MKELLDTLRKDIGVPDENGKQNCFEFIFPSSFSHIAFRVVQFNRTISEEPRVWYMVLPKFCFEGSTRYQDEKSICLNIHNSPVVPKSPEKYFWLFIPVQKPYLKGLKNFQKFVGCIWYLVQPFKKRM